MSDERTTRRGDGVRLRGRRRRSAVDRRLRPGRELLEDRLAPAVAGGLSLGGAAAVSAVAPTTAQYAVSESLGRNDPAYAMTAAGAGYSASNAANQYVATVDAGGLRVSAGGDAWSLSVLGVGYGGSLQPLGEATSTATANRVEYDYGAVSQWFVNGPLGLQQGFTLARRPAAEAGGAGSPLTVDLALGGDLTATADPGGTSVTLARADGGSALSYGGLIAYDATGKAVPAHLSVATTAAGQSLSIQVEDAGAQYPLTIDPFVQQAKLTGAQVDLSFFGCSAAMDGAGDVLIVGAKGQNFGPNNGQGLAYVFSRTGATWTQTAVLTASDAAGGDAFGTSVAISLDGATAVVGAPNAGGQKGAVYVFSPSGGSWAQTAKATVASGAAGDLFGSSVSIAAAGGAFIAGAPGAAVGGAAGQGAAYVFTGGGASWTQAARLVASDGAAGDGFGSAVAISGDAGTAVVGAPNATSQVGAVYAFTGGGGSWSSGTRLAASGLTAGRQFGSAVAASYDGGVVVVGAPGALHMQGVAYIYAKSAGSWGTPAALVGGDGVANDGFGSSVAVSADGRVALIGAQLMPSGGDANQGACYVFTATSGAWPQTAKLLAADGSAFDLFGAAVALSADGGYVLGGAPRVSPASHSLVGAAYVFNNTAPVVVTTNPLSQTAVVGAPTTFTAASSAAPAAAVSWQVSTDGGATFNNIPGATQTWYTVTPGLGDSGKQYRAYFFGADGSSAPTTAATLIVVPQTSVLTITSSANPRPIAGALNLVVDVAAANGVGAPTGQISLYIGSSLFQTANVAAGQAVFSIPAQAAGSYQIGATYSGDSTFNWSQASLTQIVSPKGTSVLTGSVPTTAVAGQPVPISGVLTYSGAPQTPNGNIMVMQDGQPIFYAPTTAGAGTLSMNYTIPSLSAGTHGIRLIYLGSQGAAAAASPIYQVVVSAAAPSAASTAPLVGSSAPGSSSSSVGGPVVHASASPASALTVTANPNSVAATVGSLATFAAAAVAGANPVGVQWQGSIDGGATFNDIPGATQTWLTVAPPLTASGYQYRAVFTDYRGSYATTTAATLTVVRQSTVLTVSSSANPIVPTSNTFNLVVDVAAANGGVGGAPTGQVNLYFGSTLYKSANVVGGQAVFTIPVLDLAGSRVGVTYSGDAAFHWSQTVFNQFITQGATTLTGSVPTSAVAGQPVPISGVMTYTGTTIPPFGGVVVMEDGNPISYIQLATSGGTTSMNYTIPSLSAGTHSIRLIYLGCPVASASASAIYTVNVSAAPAVAPRALASTAPASASTSASAPVSRTAAVPTMVAAPAPRASSALVLQGRYSVAYKPRTIGRTLFS